MRRPISARCVEARVWTRSEPFSSDRQKAMATVVGAGISRAVTRPVRAAISQTINSARGRAQGANALPRPLTFSLRVSPAA